jgi:hypothetical protein
LQESLNSMIECLTTESKIHGHVSTSLVAD